jgi:hypothetical protein
MSAKKREQISIVKYLPREPESVHAPYMPEMDFYTAVKTGNVQKVKKFARNLFEPRKVSACCLRTRFVTLSTIS